MLSNGPTIFPGGDPLGAAGRSHLDPRVVDALRGASHLPESGLSTVTRRADLIGLGARRAAVAAALQEWSGATSGTLRTTALAVLAASRVSKLRQEATRASNGQVQETVFEAFFRGVEGRAAQEPISELAVGGAEQ